MLVGGSFGRMSLIVVVDGGYWGVGLVKGAKFARGRLS